MNSIKKGRWYLVLLLPLAGAIGSFFYFTKSAAPLAGPNPGFYEQHRIMKQNEMGEIPFGLRNLWGKHDAKNYKKASNLKGVKELGPNHVGGRTRALIIDHSDNNRILAGSSSGGLWLSEDRGKSWKLRDDHALTLSVTCITQNPFNAKEFYYGTGEAMDNNVSLDGNGIFKSVDGGITFEQLASTNTTAFVKMWDIKHSLTDSSTLYASTNDQGLWKSDDAGKSFKKIFSTTRKIHEIEVFEDSMVMFTVAGLGIYKFNEKVGTISKMEGGLPSGSFDRISLAYCQSQPLVMYAQYMTPSSVDHFGLYKSTDGGITWKTLGSPKTNTKLSYSWAWYCFDIGVHPQNPNWVASISVTAGYSSDGGTTWKDMANSHADYHTIRFFKGENNFLVGNDGGVHAYSSTSPNTSTSLNNGYNVTQYYAGSYFPSGISIAAGTQDNGTWTSFDASPVFNSVLGGDGAYCAVHQQNGNTLYASWQNGNLRRASNAKAPSWADIDNPLQSSGDGLWFINPFEINITDGDQLYFPTKKRIWRTTNQGTAWTAITNKIAGNLYSVAVTPEDNPTVYFGGQSSLLYRIDSAKTAVAGSEFMMTALAPVAARGGFIGNIEINPLDHSTIFLSMNNVSVNSRLWKVWNANTNNPTWVDVSGNLPAQLPVNWVEVDSKDTNFMVAATDYGLYTSVDGGTNWIKEKAFPNVNIPMVKLRESDGQLFVYTHGRGIWTANIRNNPTTVSSAKKVDFKLFPNPTTGIVQVETRYEVKHIAAFSILGQKLGDYHSNTIDLSHLKNGEYILQVTLKDGTIETKKVLKN